MAVLFELVVNFGTGQDAAGTAAELVRRAGHIDVRGVPVPLGEPFISELKSPAYIEFSVHPRDGDPPGYDGLVLAEDLCEKWQLGPEWNAFEPGYRWLPYSGSRNF